MKRTTYIISASSLAIFAICVIFHYIYKWSGYNEIIGAIAPINESIFQHIKMTFIPTILFYLITYFIFRKKYIINKDKWAIYPLITFIITGIIITIIYYTLKYGFNISAMIIDILSLFIGLVLSSIINIKLEISNTNFKIPYYISIITLVIVFGILLYFNYYPLEVNFFYDKINNTYRNVKMKKA